MSPSNSLVTAFALGSFPLSVVVRTSAADHASNAPYSRGKKLRDKVFVIGDMRQLAGERSARARTCYYRKTVASVIASPTGF